MAYNSWKLMDKLDVAVRNPEKDERYDFTGYIVEHGDEKALESAKDWARITPYDRDKGGYQTPIEPSVYTFDNEGFTATILDSAGGSSQGGRLSFWRCLVEKEGVRFTIGVNDAILADLIKNSEIKNGVIKEKLMFARKGGQPGLIHEGMQAYEDATADMKLKAEMKSAKKTSKWEIGGVYKTLTQMSICLGQVWDNYEEYKDTDRYGSWYSRNYDALRKRKTPVEMTAWLHVYRFQDQEIPKSFNELLKKEIEDRNYVYFYTGKPPARPKAAQLDVVEEDYKLVDKLFALRKDTSYESGGSQEVKGRYTRVKNDSKKV